MRKIMVVDDEIQIRNMLKMFLEKHGYQVTVAEEGKQALRLLREAHCDLMMLDIIMPGMEGLETLMALRKTHPELKVIMMSGGGKALSMSFLPTALKLGAVKSFSKPFVLQEVLEAVEELIGPPDDNQPRSITDKPTHNGTT